MLLEKEKASIILLQRKDVVRQWGSVYVILTDQIYLQKKESLRFHKNPSFVTRNATAILRS